ncbi:MAG: alcohol dehydrogenase catalytic domain-containing protein, partial [Verrucomicrobiales bacterium]
MKAVQLLSPGSVELREVPLPTPGPEWLLVRTRATTICTSDLADIRSNPFGIPLPVVIGHEAAGSVAAVETASSGFRIGDRITAHPVHPCGVCPECRRGLAHLCSRMSHFGIDLQGTLSEYFLVRADRARKIPDPVDFATAALAEPICVSLEALRRARVASGDSLLIIGDGPFGLLMARIAARESGLRVVIAGRHDFRLGFASGAMAVNVRANPLTDQELGELSGADGFDGVILAVADPNSLETALNVLRARGRLVVFAPIHGKSEVDLSRLLAKELEILGAVNDEDLFDEAVTLLGDRSFAAGEL